VFVCVYVCVPLFVFVLVFVFMGVGVCVCGCVCVFVYVCVHVFVWRGVCGWMCVTCKCLWSGVMGMCFAYALNMCVTHSV